MTLEAKPTNVSSREKRTQTNAMDESDTRIWSRDRLQLISNLLDLNKRIPIVLLFFTFIPQVHKDKSLFGRCVYRLTLYPKQVKGLILISYFCLITRISITFGQCFDFWPP